MRLLSWNEVKYPWKTPTSLLAGQAFTLSSDPTLGSIRINSSVPIALPWRNLILGFAPLGSERLNVFAVVKRRKGWFKHPEVDFAEARIPVIHDKPAQAATIRIPSSLWQNLESEESQKRKRLDRQAARQALQPPWGQLKSHCWRHPLVVSLQTSKFGSYRLLPNGTHYYHTGQDLRAPKGTPVTSVAPGIVTYAGEMLVAGQNVIVSHGGGLFSRYMHLSRTDVKVGDEVSAGQVLAVSGNSGRVEAPHLHWELIWQGSHVDPSRFLKSWAQLCDPKSAGST